MKITCWTMNLAHPVSSLEDWAALVDRQVAEAKKQGSEIFLMPEYSAAHWLHFVPRELSAPDALNHMAGLSARAAEMMSALAKKHDLLLVSGSFPVPRPELNPPLSNRAHIHFPDGRMLTQDKLCLTPFEKDPTDWNLSPGDTFGVFEWKGYRMAVIICLDIELPSLSARISSLDIDLILVPSMTLKHAGYHRVNSCARARAVELLAAIVTVGNRSGALGVEKHVGGADIYLPCEEKFGHHGLLANIPPTDNAEGPGPMLHADIPLDEIRKLRRGGAEVWPGAWNGDHVKVQGA